MKVLLGTMSVSLPLLTCNAEANVNSFQLKSTHSSNNCIKNASELHKVTWKLAEL
jgi:hypothetical protein